MNEEEIVTALIPLTTAIVTGDRHRAAALTAVAIERGDDPRGILSAMISAMDTVGGRFQTGEFFVPEMLIAARSMKAAMEVLEPVLVSAGIRPEHTAVIGTITGDIHDIGKNLVGMMWRGANFEVIDLGVDVPPERFAEAVDQHRPAIVGISALLTTTMMKMGPAIRAIRDADRDDVKVLVGGAALTAQFAEQIGADGFAADAGSAASLARSLAAASADRDRDAPRG
jgi:5-methyltetrahydrofolate--homocysteine methyltransferase